MPANNLSGYTKRVTATAFVFLAYCVGNIIGPHAFLGSEAPVYQTGCKTIIGCTAGQFCLAALLRFVLIRRNKQRAVDNQTGGEEGGEMDDVFLDLTDFQNKSFTYSY